MERRRERDRERQKSEGVRDGRDGGSGSHRHGGGWVRTRTDN